jgi:membrane-associated phospholipid phosphatase
MAKTKMTHPHQQARRKVAVGALAVTFAALAATAALGEMGHLELRIFDLIYGMSDAWKPFALFVTQFGNAWVVVGLVGLLFVVRWNPTLALVVLRNAVLAYVLIQLFKWFVDRPRPMMLLAEVASREMNVFGSGFPSGHVAVATVLSLTLLPYLPSIWKWLPVVWIGLVAWSRMYLGVHAPLDIIGGFILGLLVVLLADFIPWPRKTKRLKT